MGAEQFDHIGVGNTAQEAFEAAREQAAYDYGHAGYTGTLAEKDGFVVFEVRDKALLAKPLSVVTAIEQAEYGGDRTQCDDVFGAENTDNILEAYSDKWGPAVCIPLGDNKYMFCGWASS